MSFIRGASPVEIVPNDISRCWIKELKRIQAYWSRASLSKPNKSEGMWWGERPTAGAARPLVVDLDWEEQVAAPITFYDCSISLPIKFTILSLFQCIYDTDLNYRFL